MRQDEKVLLSGSQVAGGVWSVLPAAVVGVVRLLHDGEIVALKGCWVVAKG